MKNENLVSLNPIQTWLDRLAIVLATTCAIHCLAMPLVLVILPVVATSFFVHEDFHWWMLLLVIPTTLLAVIMGCRKHKDKWVLYFSSMGLVILLVTTIWAHGIAFFGNSEIASEQTTSACTACQTCAGETSAMNAESLFTTLGGYLLASSHFRNYRLCRKRKCKDNDCLPAQ